MRSNVVAVAVPVPLNWNILPQYGNGAVPGLVGSWSWYGHAQAKVGHGTVPFIQMKSPGTATVTVRSIHGNDVKTKEPTICVYFISCFFKKKNRITQHYVIKSKTIINILKTFEFLKLY